jgi:hemerythrin
MPFIPWSDQLVLGIPSIDEQHRWLVDRINELHTELSLDVPNRHNVGDILESLVDYAMNHFVAEEELFQRHGYAESAAHLAERNGFTGKIMAVLDKFQGGSADVGKDTMPLLKDWLMHHITVVDKAYVPFINAQGVH